MNKLNRRAVTSALFSLGLGLPFTARASKIIRSKIQPAIAEAVQVAMEKNKIPGVSVGLVIRNQTFVFNFGLASVEHGSPVTDATIFEIGSISKAFTATLAAYAEVSGHLKLTDKVESYLPQLVGTDFGGLELFHLATHTTGGLPLQVPDDIVTEEQLLDYFRAWKPPYKAGEVRTYANPSIGTLGLITAMAMHQPFQTAMSQQIFKPLGLDSTYISVPTHKLPMYAFGYNKQDAPVRVNSGMLSDEAYGLKTTAHDLTRFLMVNMRMLRLPAQLQTALDNTRKGYFKVGEMTQDLIWEEYALPVELKVLQQGNFAAVIYNPTPVLAIFPPSPPRPDVWVNKTGSTNGFGAYVAFVPSKLFGIAVLANKNFPNEERVEIAKKIYEALY